jgi:triacylglycerol lipase
VPIDLPCNFTSDFQSFLIKNNYSFTSALRCG